jgi:hypothetical protein
MLIKIVFTDYLTGLNPSNLWLHTTLFEHNISVFTAMGLLIAI